MKRVTVIDSLCACNFMCNPIYQGQDKKGNVEEFKLSSSLKSIFFLKNGKGWFFLDSKNITFNKMVLQLK